MSRFKVTSTPIQGLLVLETTKVEDDRGHLSRLFCEEEMAGFGWRAPLVQVNFTKTLSKGTVRGFHFQNPPYAEYKYVRCIRGKVYDVALDLRAGSETFLQTKSLVLSDENSLSFLIPPGVAHGFQSLTDNVELLYMHSQKYAPEYDDGVNPLDPLIFPAWPHEITQISKKDATRPHLNDDFKGVICELPTL